MKLFSIGDTDFRCHPLLIALAPLAVIFRLEAAFAVAFISLSIHEAAHAMTAYRLGYRVLSVELQPFGFIARLDRDIPRAADAAAIYAAGPVASLCMAAGSCLMERFVPVYAESGLGVAEYNLLIAAVNLIPAFPLDGGRLAAAAFSVRGARTANRILRWSGAAAGAGFIALFVLLFSRGAVNPTFLIMGLFLIVSALRSDLSVRLPARSSGRRRTYRPVRHVAFSDDASLACVMTMLPTGGYTVINVVDGNSRRIGTIDEKQLCDAAGMLGSGATLRETVALIQKSDIITKDKQGEKQ